MRTYFKLFEQFLYEKKWEDVFVTRDEKQVEDMIHQEMLTEDFDLIDETNDKFKKLSQSASTETGEKILELNDHVLTKFEIPFEFIKWDRLGTDGKPIETVFVIKNKQVFENKLNVSDTNSSRIATPFLENHRDKRVSPDKAPFIVTSDDSGKKIFVKLPELNLGNNYTRSHLYAAIGEMPWLEDLLLILGDQKSTADVYLEYGTKYGTGKDVFDNGELYNILGKFLDESQNVNVPNSPWNNDVSLDFLELISKYTEKSNYNEFEKNFASWADKYDIVAELPTQIGLDDLVEYLEKYSSESDKEPTKEELENLLKHFS